MIAGDESHEQHVCAGQSEQVALLDQVHRVLVQAAARDETADFVQQGRGVQEHAESRFELVVVGEFFEELPRESGDVQCVRFVELVFAAEVESRAGDLSGEVVAPAVHRRHLTQQPVTQVDVADE